MDTENRTIDDKQRWKQLLASATSNYSKFKEQFSDFYLICEYVHSRRNKRDQDPRLTARKSVMFKKELPSDVIDKWVTMKETYARLVDKVKNLDNRFAGLPGQAAYIGGEDEYEEISKQLASCQDLIDLSEEELLEELESRIDIHKEEEQLEQFIKKQEPGREGYGIYKLKTKAMN